MTNLLEICCSSIQDAQAAEEGGADRVELCTGLSTGGLTPSGALIRRVAREISIPARVLIRPREGHFIWTTGERVLVMEEIEMAVDAGADGVVLGGLSESGEIDQRLLDVALRRIAPARITFHRAFDECRDLARAYRQLCDYEINCVLTSGGAPTAVQGLPQLRELIDAGSTQVMAGAGVRPDQLEPLLAAGVTAFHLSARRLESPTHPHRLFDGTISVVDRDVVIQMRTQLDDSQGLRRP